MMVGKVSASSVVGLLLVNVLWLTYNFVASTEIECIPLKLCPMAMRLIKNKPFAPETIKFLRYSHCGYKEKEPEIWCPLFSECKTPDSKNGTCQFLDDCVPVLEYISSVDRDNPIVRKYLKEYRSTCSTDQDPEVKVCCPDEGKLSHVVTTTDIQERFSHNLPDPNLGECGKGNLENKIIGGIETSLDEYPWMVLLKYVNGSKTQFACGGTLINDQYVLTAAHCVDPQIIQMKNLGKLGSVILGEYDTRNETDCIYLKYGVDCADPPQEIAVSSYKIHPDFNISLMINDIAVVRLEGKAKFSDYVQPICLPPIDFRLNGNETLMISGWGRTETEKRSPVKRKALVTYADRAFCDQFNKKRRLTEGQICVGEGKGVDSCYGDSGGPLMINIKSKIQVFTFLIGIISYGYTKLCGSFPGVYTYIPPYLTWIQDEIR